MEAWKNIWNKKNISNKETNVTSNFDFALDYSYNFNTGVYEELVIKIENIPLEAFVSYREENYEDNEDLNNITNLSNKEKTDLINSESLFLVDLFPYKDLLKITLISKK